MDSSVDNMRFPTGENIASVHQLFAYQLSENPEAIAISFADNALTYKDLDKDSEKLANLILSKFPHSPIIGISSTRSVEMITGLIAIMKAGKAYLPLDPTYPRDRLSEIIGDSGIVTCLAQDSEINFFDSFGISTLPLVHHLQVEAMPKPDDPSLVYVLYTSGSTGKPKGVCMGHRAMVNLLLWQKRHSKAGKGTNTLQFTPLTFDVSFQEIFSTLCTGGTLVMIEDDKRLNPQALLTTIQDQQINRIFLPFVALQYLTEAADASNYFPTSLREVITAGEQLKITPQVKRFFTQLSNCRLFNQYGPTECHVVSELPLDGDPTSWPPLPSIGKAIDNTEIMILNEDLQLLPDGESGELCIGGACVAHGYLNRQDLTAEKFIQWNHPSQGSMRIYKTGDLAKYLPDGNIEFLGRIDVQVKIRGYRIEPGEIEVFISNQEGIKQAVVAAREDVPGQKRLVAYCIASGEKKDTAGLRKAIEKKLPDYMIPSAFVWLNDFPRTTSGKVDRNALPKPEMKRPDLSVLYKSPVSKLENILSNLWSTLLLVDKVGVNDNFFELGGNSLLALKTVAGLKNQHGLELQITKLYQYPTIAGISKFLEGRKKSTQRESINPSAEGQDSRDVAVIAMAGRFPGANTIDQLWDLLKNGNEPISFFGKEELDPQISAELKNDPDYVCARGLIEGPAEFDPAFFGINPKMAGLMDPQQRIFLEIAWEVLENAGYFPERNTNSIAVFAGTGNNSYYLNNVLGNRALVDRMGSFQVMTFNEKDYVASRTSYELDLKGPAVSVHSACSTSLLAIAQAVECIRDGRCNLAIAGGSAITSPIKSGHLYQEGAMLSRDGHCRPFDAEATGTLFSDGAGVVLLKSRMQAEKDGDKIFALIKGVGVNNDGGAKGSFTAPSAEGQSGAINMAITDAGIDPSTITYVEAHGTATPVGDPIEIEGLNIAFGAQEKKQFCALGSIKSNMGHLTAAAGVAGFIKTVLSLYNRQIPPSINYHHANPDIDFLNSPFYVNDRLTDWDSKGSRRAGVSSFGVGGTNVHIVLEEFPQAAKNSGPGRPVHLINWSAKSQSSREAYSQSLKQFMEGDAIKLADLSYSLQIHRASFNARRFLIATDKAELLGKLSSNLINPSESKLLQESPGDLVFMFPGQGSQYINMGKDLYQHDPVFTKAVDECARLLERVMNEDIRKVIYPAMADQDADVKIDNTYYTQPALFVIEYAMAKLWMSWGILPSAFVGHSIGEFVAAHLAGVLSLEDALNLIATRGRLMSELPRGSMLGIRSGHDQITPLLTGKLSLAAINSPALCVVAGPMEEVDHISKVLQAKGISNKLLHTSHAFHSAMMDPILSPFEALVSTMKLGIPKIPILSSVTGDWLKDAEAMSPSYWANHLRSTVRFSHAITALLTDPSRIFLETGPRNVTATLARQHPSSKPVVSISSLDPGEGKSEYYSVMRALGQLWLQGIEPNWQAFYSGQERIKLDLPSYSFEKNKYWVEPLMTQIDMTASSVAPANKMELTLRANLETVSSLQETPIQHKPMRKASLIEKLKDMLENASGIDMDGIGPEISFVEMGLDSLLLTQVALNLKREFAVPITFRQLNEEYGNLELLSTYLDNQLPKDESYTRSSQMAVPAAASNRLASVHSALNQDAIGLISQQIQLLAQQISLLQNNQVNPSISSAAPTPMDTKKETEPDLSPEEVAELKKPFGASAKIEKRDSNLTDKQRTFLDDLIRRYTEKTKQSKAYTQEHRSFMADPRVVSGFRPLTKEIVYSLVVNRSKGSRLWDLDGNEYIDALNGFGSNLLGYQPEVITNAIRDQIEKGYELGPQHELAGAVCRLICQFTGFDRSALCNTGSEAVLGALRIARTVTGRSKVVAFAGSYHGINDEVIIRGSKKLKSFPAAPGIMPEAVQNMIILEYGTEQSLQIIRELAQDLAAVLVEPIQSRRPEFQPVEFLKELRKITLDSGSALIFDEVITGFRAHPRGTQGIFDIKADLGTYGKVIAGGMPIGVIAGKKQFMDALDGGYWQYGDQSLPEAGVTYFAGTFVRHPLALAASKASLEYMQAKGPSLQEGLNKMTDFLAEGLNSVCESFGIPVHIAHFGSLWKLKFKEEIPYSELVFTLMRLKGVHIWDGFPCFLTEAHTLEDLKFIIDKFEESIEELVEAGFLNSPKSGLQANGIHKIEETPPIPGARLGRDKEGHPAWFITDPNRPGKYLQLS